MCVSVIEIDCVLDAVKGERNCLAGRGAVKVIFQKGYYSSCHRKSIGLRTRLGWMFDYETQGKFEGLQSPEGTAEDCADAACGLQGTSVAALLSAS